MLIRFEFIKIFCYKLFIFPCAPVSEVRISLKIVGFSFFLIQKKVLCGFLCIYYFTLSVVIFVWFYFLSEFAKVNFWHFYVFLTFVFFLLLNTIILIWIELILRNWFFIFNGIKWWLKIVLIIGHCLIIVIPRKP